jgi:hypothetical protein
LALLATAANLVVDDGHCDKFDDVLLWATEASLVLRYGPLHGMKQYSKYVTISALRVITQDLVKGRVSRDFSSPVFFIKQLLLVPMGMSRNDFEFFRIFVELFVFVIDSPVMNTPGSRLESLK